jgi:hypothetical protein
MPHTKRKFSECLNCGTRLAASHAYCPECGQANHDLNIPVRHFLGEAVEGIFHFDTKSIRTILALTFNPGFVTSEFIKGKRVRYVAPVKLYVFISFLFFLLLSVMPGRNEPVSSADSPSTSIGITFFGINSQELRGMKNTQLDSVMQTRGIELSMLNKYIVRQLSRLGTLGPEGFNHLLMKGISYMMFALMPFFALFVFLLFRKKALYYIGTLIFSIHYHSFVFLLLTASLIVNRLAGTSLTMEIPLIVCPIYLFFALRHVYKDSCIKTIGKTLLIGVLQTGSLTFLFIVTTFISLLII